MYLTNLKIESDLLAKKAIVCGDPNRAKFIAAELENTTVLAENREYVTYGGTYQNEKVVVVSHGVGASGAAICFEQLIQGGVEEIIRVGTAGSYQKEIQPGSLVISTAAVSKDGLSKQIAPEGFPAVADISITQALLDASKKHDFKIHSGITLTLDVFYEGAISFPHHLYQKAGVLAVEMEISALFTIAAIRGIKAGAIVAIDGFADADLAEEYDPHNQQVAAAIEKESKIAIEALIHIK